MWSAGPGQGDRADLAEDRGEVLEGPLLADPAVVGDPVDVDGVPSDGRPLAGTPSRLPVWVAVTTRRSATRSALAIASCTVGLDVRQGADEAAEDGDDVVDPRDGSECTAVPRDVGREVVAGAFRVAAR